MAKIIPANTGEFSALLEQTGLNVKGDIRNAVVTGNKIIFGINNEKPLVYKF